MVYSMLQCRRHQRHRRGHAPISPPPPLSPLFCVAKREKGDKSKKERVSKQKLLKGCHQGQNITILAILERLEFENLSCRPTMVADNTFQCCSILPPPPSPPPHFEIHFAGPEIIALFTKTYSFTWLSLKKKPLKGACRVQIWKKSILSK